MWPFTRKGSSEEIAVGDRVTIKPEFHGLETYFKNGPLRVIGIEEGPKYAGGKFIIVDWAGTEQGFYLNAVKKV
jgi:hypothetical protein